ncbi:MAG: hypothetical protein K2G41_11185 [Duncaniella sp.]|uniref:hypothetical protein n=1 Tax=Duncaniella sp. TaxID=2518496 RepID=UPI0023C8ED58|nr:hypothetical protein [Duncaniella sp.]MDE6091248.1 hypothetical protein [Duncaniella sp.]
MIETQTTCLFDEMLDASTDVDYSNVCDATGYATLILSVANDAGMLYPTGNKQSYEAIQTIKLAKEWVYNVRTNICKMEAGHAMDMLAPYDLMHRLAHHSSTPKAFADEYLLKAFEARVHGDRSVNEYHLYRFIKEKLNRRDKSYFGRPLEWYASSLDRWYKKFRNGRASENLSDYDTLEIVSILMSEDLFAFAGSDQNTFKKRLFDNHRNLLDNIDFYGLKELEALSHYISWSGKFMSQDKFCNYSNAITLAQIARPETNRFYRVTLQYNLAELNGNNKNNENKRLQGVV